MSEPLDLDALEALAEAATPGPWTTLGFSVRDTVGSRVAETTFVSGPEDAPFIAAARTAVPALVARVRELEAKQESRVRSGERISDVYSERDDLRSRLEAARHDALIEAADAIQTLHPGEVKNSVLFLRELASQSDTGGTNV